MPRIVADLGNSRLKWGRLDPAGRLADVVSLPTDDPDAWRLAWNDWGLNDSAEWAVASVNPPCAQRFGEFLRGRVTARVRWYRSAQQVGLRHTIDHPETAGADRAMAVSAAVTRGKGGVPGIVVLCGTAVTVERIGADGVWQGGAIAAGLVLTARALNALTAQLPLVTPHATPPPPWGASTRPALEAGVFWGVVGAVRELVRRQAERLSPAPWVVWSGGDAPVLASCVDWPGAVVIPDLVLHGLADRWNDR